MRNDRPAAPAACKAAHEKGDGATGTAPVFFVSRCRAAYFTPCISFFIGQLNSSRMPPMMTLAQPIVRNTPA